MTSMPLNPPAEREYIIPERLGRTMIYHISDEGECKGEKPEATAVGEDLGSLVGVEGVEVAGSGVAEGGKVVEGMAERVGVEVGPVVRGVRVVVEGIRLYLDT